MEEEFTYRDCLLLKVGLDRKEVVEIYFIYDNRILKFCQHFPFSLFYNKEN